MESTPTMATLAQSTIPARMMARVAIDIQATPAETSLQRLVRGSMGLIARDLSLPTVRGVVDCVEVCQYLTMTCNLPYI